MPWHYGVSWLAFKAYFSPNDWAYFTHYSAWCSAQNIHVADAGETTAARFIDAFEDSGRKREYGESRLAAMRKRAERIRIECPDALVPPLDPPAGRSTPRQDQFEDAPETLKGDFLLFGAIYGPQPPYASAKKEKKALAVRDEKQRFLLRMILLAETARGRLINRLSELFEISTLEAIELKNYGADRSWKDSPKAIHTRSKLFEYGRKYAYNVLQDEALGDNLDLFLLQAPQEQKRRGTLSSKTREASRALDYPEIVERLRTGCLDSIKEFGDRLTSKGAYEDAQAAAGTILLLATGRAPFVVMTAAFRGPPRQMAPGASRPTIVFEREPSLDVEGQLAEATLLALDCLWIAAKRLLRRPPQLLFEKRNGVVKSGSAFTIGLKKLCKRLKLALVPKAIQVGVARGLINDGHKLEDIADMLGISQLVNLRSRFGSILGATASQKHADAQDKKRGQQ
jgi:hypothetical protein